MKTNALQLISSSAVLENDVELLQQAQIYFENADSKNTKKAYKNDWQNFVNWCQVRQRAGLPANVETVGLYISDLAQKYKVSTIKRRLAVISRVHQEFGFDSPTNERRIKNLFKGIKNTKGVVTSQKKAILSDDIKQMIERMTDSLQACRDKALILTGYAGAFRRSELVNLNMEDLEFTDQGVVIYLRKSKTDQVGQGYKKAICYGESAVTCPVLALRAWLDLAGIESGPVFRSFDIHNNLKKVRLCDKGVALIVKKYAKIIGKTEIDFAGHSLRSGSVTQGAINGANNFSLMAQGGWKNMNTVNRYVRDANIFRDNLSAKLGL